MTIKADMPKAIEAAAKELFALHEPDLNAWRWNRPDPNDPNGPFAWHQYWINAAAVTVNAALAHLRLAVDTTEGKP